MRIQAMDGLMPGFDKEIAKMAQRVLINPRKIDWYTGVLATKVTPGKWSEIHITVSEKAQNYGREDFAIVFPNWAVWKCLEVST